MAYEPRPSNSLFDMNPSDIFRDFGRQLFPQLPESTMKTDFVNTTPPMYSKQNSQVLKRKTLI
ncbi:hypothetical protein ACFOU0_13925 [Salinicoccus sesuvii]|uniref:Uncharacterized protein n=1 Tax=Salinicoccus sesuvii TaxID=868281 RepID=A0ABV7N964_9STAP